MKKLLGTYNKVAEVSFRNLRGKLGANSVFNDKLDEKASSERRLR